MQILAWVFFMFGGVNPEAAIYIMNTEAECRAMAQQVGGQSKCKLTLILTEKQK